MKKDIHRELEDASFLSKMKGQKEGFELPDNYFQHLQVDMMQKVREEQVLEKKPERFGFWHSWQSWAPKVSIGMMAVAVVALIGVSLLEMPVDAGALAWDSISDDELYKYLNTNIETLDLEALASLSEETELDFLTEGIESDQLDAYMEEMIDEMEDSEFDNLF